MNADDCKLAVASEAQKAGWKVKRVNFRACTALIAHIESGAEITAQWTSRSGVDEVRSAVRMFIDCDGSQAIKQKQGA